MTELFGRRAMGRALCTGAWVSALLAGPASGCRERAPAETASAPLACSEPRRFVVATLNTHSFQEGDSSLAKLRAIGAGLAELGADLVALNEVMAGQFFAHGFGGAVHDGAAIVREALEAASGVAWHVAVCPFAHWESGEEMANVALSRTPILESECLPLTTTDFWPAPTERRNVLYARTQVPDFGPVALFVTHAWGWHSADTEAQVREVKTFMAARRRGDEGLVLLAGDLNMPATWPAYGLWLEAPPLLLVDTFALANPGQAGFTTLTGEEHRIDYILAAPGANDAAIRVGESFVTFDDASHPRLPRVSDHRGVVTVFLRECAAPEAPR